MSAQVEVLSATPLLLDRLVNKQRVDLSTCRMLVLDEADRLLEGGFVWQIDVILQAATHSRLVRALFSATLPEVVEHSARSVMRDPLHITVGQRNAATSLVEQRLVFVGQEKGRLLAMRYVPMENHSTFPPCCSQGLGAAGTDPSGVGVCVEQGAGSGAAQRAHVRRRRACGQHPCRPACGAAGGSS